MKLRHKSDIPNTPGFRFAMVHASGERIPCVVQKLPQNGWQDGMHTAVDERTGKPLTASEPWSNFTGWEAVKA